MKTIKIGAVVLVGLAVLLVVLQPNSLRKAVFAAAMPEDYFTEYLRIQPALYQVNNEVYAFERGFARSLVIDSSEGLAVIETFDLAHTNALNAALADQFPTKPVRWVVFSHNHLDHIRGSDIFASAEVIGHKDINQLVEDWPKAAKSVAKVTREISGDTQLKFGDTMIEALYMPMSHSSTLYGFHIPSASVVFAPDMMFVNAVPPFGFPDFYYPGYVRALDRLIDIKADHYVPSHMDRGSYDDMVAFRNMTVEFQEVVEDEMLKIGANRMGEGEGLKHAIKSAYERLQPSYGHIHGFDSMFVAKFGRHFGGTYLGY